MPLTLTLTFPLTTDPNQVTVMLYQMLEASMDVTSTFSDSAVCDVFIEALTHADTYTPGSPYCTYGSSVPVSCVLYVPEAQGSLPRRGAMNGCTRTSPGRTVAP